MLRMQRCLCVCVCTTIRCCASDFVLEFNWKCEWASACDCTIRRIDGQNEINRWNLPCYMQNATHFSAARHTVSNNRPDQTVHYMHLRRLRSGPLFTNETVKIYFVRNDGQCNKNNGCKQTSKTAKHRSGGIAISSARCRLYKTSHRQRHQPNAKHTFAIATKST